MDIKALGIDIAKRVFEICGMDKNGRVILRKKLSREKLTEYIVQLPPCLIGMEACSGAHYWARRFIAMGHEVKLITPYFVKPYVKSNKNDRHDAQAICEAVTRPTMRFAHINSVEQQDIQSVHRVRSRVVKERTAVANQIRGLAIEYGIVIPQGIPSIMKQLPFILEDADNELTLLSRELLAELLEQLKALDKKVKHYTAMIEHISHRYEVCQRMMQVEGIGVLTATALIATVGDGKQFRNGREMAAFLGLVPRQHSSGGKSRLLGISKRGDRYLRCLLVHGARSALSRCKHIPEKKAQWLAPVIERRGKNRATVALANKNVRTLWAIMARDEIYQLAA